MVFQVKLYLDGFGIYGTYRQPWRVSKSSLVRLILEGLSIHSILLIIDVSLQLGSMF